MRKKIVIIFLINIFTVVCSFGQDYNASFFGCVSDGVTNNTASIQAGIDLISSKGGGTLHFYVGRYLTGGLELKSNVVIEIHEGAVLAATPNVNDYTLYDGLRSMVYGNNISNVKIIGKGVIEANPSQYFDLVKALESKKLLSQNYLNTVPSLITLVNCKDVEVKGIILQKSLKTAVDCINSQNVQLEDLIIRHNERMKGTGINLLKSSDISLSNIFVEHKSRAIVNSDSKILMSKNCITSDGSSIL